MTSVPPTAAAGAPGRSRRDLALLVAGLLLASIALRAFITIVGPLTDEIRGDLDLSRGAAGLLTTLTLLAFGIVSPIAPRLAARFGPDRVLVAAMGALAASLVLRTLPPLALLFVGTLAAGSATALANVLLPALIKRGFPAHAGFMVAMYSVALGIGAALAAGLAVPSMGWLGDSWRAAFAIWAVPPLLGALLWLPQVRAAAAPAAGERVRVTLWRDRVAWLVAGYLAFLAFGYYAMTAWLPDIYLVEGMSAGRAGGVLSIALTVGLPLGLVVGIGAQRLPDQRPLALGAMLPAAAGWVGVLLAPMAAPWLWATLLGCGYGIGFPLAMSLMVLRAPDMRHAAELSGMAQSMGYTVAAISPVAVGALHDLLGSWKIPLVVLIASTAPGLVLAIGASRRRFVGAAAAAPAAVDAEPAPAPAA